MWPWLFGSNQASTRGTARLQRASTAEPPTIEPSYHRKNEEKKHAEDTANQAAIAGWGTLLAAHGYCRPATSTATRRLQAWTRHRRGRRRRRRAAPRAWTRHPPDHHARDGQGRWRRPRPAEEPCCPPTSTAGRLRRDDFFSGRKFCFCFLGVLPSCQFWFSFLVWSKGRLDLEIFLLWITNDKLVLFCNFDLIIMQPAVGILGVWSSVMGEALND